MPKGVYPRHPSMKIYERAPMRERFWKHVRKTKSCWRWRGSHGQDGYGRITPDGEGLRNCNYMAHRASWEIHNGPIPPGLLVCHSCDVRDCVNPDHLFLGSPDDNHRDMLSKHRHAHGERGGNAKLTAESVLEIRKLHAIGASMYGLGKRFNVGPTTIAYIVKRQTWRHL